MNEFLQCVKRAALDAYESEMPACPLVGTVESIDPVTVRLTQRMVIPSARLLFLYTEYEREVELGDRLLLMRFPGGQLYAVLGWIS